MSPLKHPEAEEGGDVQFKRYRGRGRPCFNPIVRNDGLSTLLLFRGQIPLVPALQSL